jgi:hypothetical protein
LLTLNSIAWLSSRAVPVADIYAFLREPDPLLRTLLVFRSGRKPYERDYVVGSVEIGGKLLTCNLYLVPANSEEPIIHSYNCNNKGLFSVRLVAR